MKSQFPLDDLYWLVADVNTAEIASHIEHDNLSQWCNSWHSSKRSYPTSKTSEVRKRLNQLMVWYKEGRR